MLRGIVYLIGFFPLGYLDLRVSGIVFIYFRRIQIFGFTVTDSEICRAELTCMNPDHTVFSGAFNGNGCSRIVFCHNNRRIRKDQIIRQENRTVYIDLWCCNRKYKPRPPKLYRYWNS